MTDSSRGFAVGRAVLLGALLALVGLALGAAYLRADRARTVTALQSAAESYGMRLRRTSTEGLLGTRGVHRVELEVAPNLSLQAEGVTFEPDAERDHFHADVLRAFGAAFRDVHVWLRERSTALEIRLGHAATGADALELGLIRRPGEGVELTLDIPSQPLARWASQLGLTVDERWAPATIVGTGSLVVPESREVPARANLRFTLDRWPDPRWPDGASLTGRSGAVALRMAPGSGPVHPISRVEVETGLFSLVGTGRLSIGERSVLSFDARGRQSCVRLRDHLPPSSYRERVRAHLAEHPEAVSDGGVVLELAVRAEAPDGAPLSFRWHLHGGCGLPERQG